MLLFEFADPTRDAIKRFVSFAKKELDLNSTPKVTIKRDSAYSAENHTFGHFSPDDNSILLQVENRQMLDILRTLAHEMVHYKQNKNNELTPESGEDGSEHENEANAQAGVIMRKYARMHPELFNRLPE